MTNVDAQIELLRELATEARTYEGQFGRVTAGLDWRDIESIHMALTQRADELAAKRAQETGVVDKPRDNSLRERMRAHCANRYADDEVLREMFVEWSRVVDEATVLARIGQWTHEHGTALNPPRARADTYGEGMRDAKRQVAALLLPAPTRDESVPPPGWNRHVIAGTDRSTGMCSRGGERGIKLAEAWRVYDAEHGYAPAVDEATVERITTAIRAAAFHTIVIDEVVAEAHQGNFPASWYAAAARSPEILAAIQRVAAEVRK